MLSDLAFGLSERGVPVEVVSGRKAYQNRTPLGGDGETVRGVKVHRIFALPIRGRRVISRAADYGTFYLFAFFRLLRVLKRGDMVLALTDPPLISVCVCWAARIKGAKTGGWLHDIFPEVAEELGFRAAKGLPGRLMKWFRNRALENSELVVVIGHKMQEMVVRKMAHPRNVVVIPNWFNADEGGARGSVLDSGQLRDAWGVDGKFVVGYSGNLGRAHSFEEFVQAGKMLKDDEDIVFLIVGGGVLYQELQARVESEGLGNFVFLPYQPRSILSASLAVPDVHLISLNQRLEGLIVPSKFYGIAAAGRPSIFVGDPNGEIAKVIEDARCGRVVGSGDGQGLAEVIRELKANRALASAMGENAHRLYTHEYTKEKSIDRWFRALSDRL